MSYILDALKKSEAERRAAAPAGGVSGAVYVVEAVPGFAGWRPLALAAVVLVVLAVVALWPSGERDTAIAAAPPPPVAVDASPTVREALADLQPAPAPVAATPAKPVGDPGLARRSRTGDAPAASKAAPARDLAADRGSPVRATAVAAKAPSPPPVAAVAAPVPFVPATSAAVVSRTAGAAASSAIVATASPPSAREGAAAGDGPGGPVTSELPRLVVSGFAGGDDRDARFAVINDRIVREGEEFAPDLRLTHVGQDGVEVEYRGKRYRP